MTERTDLGVVQLPQLSGRLLLSVTEFAQAIGCSQGKGYLMVRSGEVPSVRIGGLLRVPVDAVRAMIARDVAQSQPAA